MIGFIDIHTHILPATDDGAKDMAEAITMLKMAWDCGTRMVVLTPHYRAAYKKIATSQIYETFHQLVAEAQQEVPGMELRLGRELHNEQDLPDKLRTGEAIALAQTRYVLLEFSSVSLRSQIVRGVENVLYSGYVPIIAHVERYAAFREDKDLIDEVLNMGALIQVNAESVLGENGWGTRRYCHKLLRTQKVHFIASDAHQVDWRPPVLDKCWERISKKYGYHYAEQIFRQNAEKILGNREL